VFARERWTEVRLDIDSRVQPDVVGSITDVGALFQPASFDAVWSSHSIEHLHTHQVAGALKGIRSVLRPDGFVIIRCPDLETAVALMLGHGTDFVVYESAVGPITPLDMMFGHSRSIANGYQHMAHHTGFTSDSLGRALLDADFATVITKRESFDLWALGLCCDTARTRVQIALADAGLYMFDADCAPFIAGDTQPAGAP
jgi:predicted SAM-dependent methyltransferase